MSLDDSDGSGRCRVPVLGLTFAVCVCAPKLGCLYCLLGNHPSRSVSLCLDIKGRNWRTGSELEPSPMQGSLSLCCFWKLFIELTFRMICGRQEQSQPVLTLDKNILQNIHTHTHRSSLAWGLREMRDSMAFCTISVACEMRY